MGRVVVVGSINQDVVIRVPHLPAGGETVLGHGHSLIPGGKGANQAVAAARIGAAVTMVGRIGDDAAGGMLTAALAAAGVDVGHIGVDGEHGTGRAFVLVDDRAQNAIALSPGANLMLAPHHLPAGVLADADVVSLQLEVPIATVTAAVAAARRSVLNAAPAASLPQELLQTVDVLVVNESEAAALTRGAAVTTPLQALSAAEAITAPAAVVVTLGAGGAVVRTRERRRHIPAPTVTAVDTTAAGDAFCGAVAARLADGAELEDAVEWGVAAGAVAVTRAGAQPSLPSREEVAALL